MNSILIISFFILIILLSIWAIINLVRFDSAIQDIYEKNYAQWCKIGKPSGFFWWPKEKVNFFASTNARNKLLFQYLFKIKRLKAMAMQVDEQSNTTESK